MRFTVKKKFFENISLTTDLLSVGGQNDDIYLHL